jgi:hypothetical protein
MTWNKKNDQYALSCRLRPSSNLLLRWILRRAKLNQVGEIEIDLRVFNAWVGKNRGRAYDAKTIREAIAQLDEKTQGLVLITKSYTPWIKKLLIKPLEFILQEKTQDTDKIPQLKTVNPMFEADHKKRLYQQQQQDISKIKHLLGSLGLKYTEDAIYRLWRYAGKKVESVQKAVEYMLYSHGKKLELSQHESGIDRPHGWLNDCLRYGWHIEAGFYIDGGVELPYFGERGAIPEFIDGILNLVKDCQGLQT